VNPQAGACVAAKDNENASLGVSLSNFFLRRPIFAAVCSLVILIAGLIVIPTMPVAQYPQIAPPTVSVSAPYTGADPETVEASVTTPLEQAINGVQGLRYISSTSAQGLSTINCTFDLGTNLDIAATDVQNAVQSATGLLPALTKQLGVTVSKNSGTFIMGVAIVSDSSQYDTLFLSNYAELNIVNDLKRIPGVSGVQIFGQRRYAMRIWVNPQKLQANGLAMADVVNALQDQNITVAGGNIGGSPESPNQQYTVTVRGIGQLTDPKQFANIIIRANPNGGFTRLGDVARTDLGAEDYSSFLRYNGNQNVVGLGVQQLSTANALTVSHLVRQRIEQLQASFPAGVHSEVAFDSTQFVSQSIHDVLQTLIIAIILVIAVIYLFLQDGRATLIPAVTIPISLIGVFAIMKVFGFSINTVTLFGITLATGLVVDDAIVVIENIERIIRSRKIGSLEGAEIAMHEIQGAVVASSLVLLAVFVPVAFFPGTTGLLYKQFAVTISGTVAISLFTSLTLSPALATLLMKFQDREPRFALFKWFNAGYARFHGWYDRVLPWLMGHRAIPIGMFLVALAAVGFMFVKIPSGFVPTEDQGYLIALVQAPQGTSLARLHTISIKAEKLFLAQPEVDGVFNIGGFSFSGSAPNNGIMFLRLRPWGARPGLAHTSTALVIRLYQALAGFNEALVLPFNPPAINGVGSFSGFQFELEDRGNLGLPALNGAANQIIAGAARDPNLSQVFTQFRIDAPQLIVNVDRDKVRQVGGSVSDVYSTLGSSLSDTFINDFNYIGRAYHVFVMADEPYRNTFDSLNGLYVRGSNGGLSPISGVASIKHVLAPPIITHFNLYRNIEITGQPASGKSSGDAIAAMGRLAASAPRGINYEWSGLTLDEIASGGLAALIFALGVVFVFLVLSALYESWIDPLIVMLAVPAALLGALGFIYLHNLIVLVPMFYFLIVKHLFVPPSTLSNDVYAQVGFVMLIGLASKNAILIVQFANQQVERGANAASAAISGAQTRLRPILMTSIAFVIGATPLMLASGAGSASRQSIGTVVVGGMLVSTFLNLLITPVIYAIIKGLELRGQRPKGGDGVSAGRIPETVPAAPAAPVA
jgi:HAE1 family hydrophobic/amphiphilic exporter-1